MNIWIQSLSWTLIYGVGQGFLVYSALRLIFKLATGTPSNSKYYLSLFALSVLLVWFVATWWRQYSELAVVAERLRVAPATDSTIIVLQPVAAADYMNRFRSGLSSLSVIFPWLSGAYILGLSLMLARLSAGMLQLFSLKRNAVSQPDAALNELWLALKSKMRWNGPVQLLISAQAQVPMVIGFLKPIVLLPAVTVSQLSTEQVETILLHELVHLKRYDYFINILQTVVETILFFNPFVWLISSICRKEREYSCDDMVLEHTREPIAYATALAALASPDLTYSRVVVAASGEPTHLFNRIKRIMEMKKSTFSYSRTTAAVLIIAIVACLAAWLPSSVAGPREDKSGKEKREKTSKVKDIQQAAEQPDVAPLPREEKPGLPKEEQLSKANDASDAPENNGMDLSQSEEGRLTQMLMDDGLVNQVKGFVVEKIQNDLFINGEKQTNVIAKKYLQNLTQGNIRVQVFSFGERLNMHPDASFLQLLLPVSLQSGCVDAKPKKAGC